MSFEAIKDKLTPMAFAESLYQMNGQDLRFGVGRRYLKPIYNADIEQMLLMTGRQVEKTTTASIKIGNSVLLKPFSRSLYVAPLNEQVKVFSQTRLDKLFRYSKNDLVKRRYISSDLTNQVFQKEYLNGSEVFLRNCYEEADNIRGLSIDDISIDELQDIYLAAIPVILETQARSKNPTLFLTGTPKTLSNTIQQKWEESSQADWVITCPACRRDQVMWVDSITPEAYLCRNPKCRKPIDDLTRAFGRWEHRFPERKFKGFRITQMMIPDMDPARIYQKIEDYPTGKLYNEVLGHSYENADKPIKDSVMVNSIDPEASIHEKVKGLKTPVANKRMYMGIDWGEGEKEEGHATGYTTVVVYADVGEGKLQLVNAKRFAKGEELDPDHQLKFILKWYNEYRPKITIADYGGGLSENKRLKKRIGSSFFMAHYVGQQKETITYHPKQFEYRLFRSSIMTDFIHFVNEMNLVFPGVDFDEWDYFMKNFTGIYSEYRQTRNGASERLFYGHPVSQPDDYFHASLYAWLGREVENKGIRKTVRKKGSGFFGTYGR